MRIAGKFRVEVDSGAGIVGLTFSLVDSKGKHVLIGGRKFWNVTACGGDTITMTCDPPKRKRRKA